MKQHMFVIDGPSGAGKTVLRDMLGSIVGRNGLSLDAAYIAIGLRQLQNGFSHIDSAAQITEGDIEASRLRVFDPDYRQLSLDVAAVEGMPVAVADAIRRIYPHDRRLLIDGCGSSKLFPEAQVQMYLTADFDERVRRKLKWYDDHRTGFGIDKTGPVTIEFVNDEVLRLDSVNEVLTGRPAISPFKLFLDTTRMSENEVFERASAVCVRHSAHALLRELDLE